MSKKTKVKVVKCVPYQLCPKCNGDGTVFVQTWNGSSVSLSSGPVDCDVCLGGKIIPMYQI